MILRNSYGCAGPSAINVCNPSESIQRGQRPLVADVSGNANELKSLHTSLQGETDKLCQTLKLSVPIFFFLFSVLFYLMFPDNNYGD